MKGAGRALRLPRACSALLGPLAKESARSGVALYAVGGCVRDWLLGRPTLDIDLVAEGDPLPLARAASRRFGGELEAFDRFGTVRLRLQDGSRLDFARARAESYPAPAALPVVRPAGLRQDLARRDFTVNAMALSLEPGGARPVLDPFDGQGDLKARRLRALHPASFRDDPTRIFRAARYAGRLGLRLERGTAAWLAQALRRRYPGLLSRERLRQELWRILAEEDPGPALRLLRRWGLWPAFHPAFSWPPAAARLKDPGERLGLIALSMPGGAGGDFLRSMPLPRDLARDLQAALKAAAAKASLRGALAPRALAALRARFPGLAPAALKPLLLSGEDLKRLGLPPGREFSLRLERAARAQWRGEFQDRAGALRWLRRQK